MLAGARMIHGAAGVAFRRRDVVVTWPAHARSVPPIHTDLIDKRPVRTSPNVTPRVTEAGYGPPSAGSHVDHSFERMTVYPTTQAGYLIDEEGPAPEPDADRGGGVLLGQSGPGAGVTPEAGTTPDAGTTPACTIVSTTRRHAPDGTADSRVAVGVCEDVTFIAGGIANWTATGGSPTSAPGRASFLWSAPSTGGTTTTITAAPAGGAASPCTIDISTSAPSSIAMHRHALDAFPPGAAGAGMLLEARFAPRNVSFGFIEWLEDPGPASGVSGYFAGLAAAGVDLSHHPNPAFVPIRPNNTFRSDHAAGSGFAAPWSAGAMQWDIPNRYRRIGSGDAGTVFTTTHQHFSITAAGVVTITKGGASVSRAP